jgi:hypothetical protein
MGCGEREGRQAVTPPPIGTRTAAALTKRLFEAGRVTRILFLIDRTEIVHL